MPTARTPLGGVLAAELDGPLSLLGREAYDRLLDGFGLTCLDPRREVADALVFLDRVCRTALADRTLGALRSDACVSALCDTLGLTGPDVLCDLGRRDRR